MQAQLEYNEGLGAKQLLTIAEQYYKYKRSYAQNMKFHPGFQNLSKLSLKLKLYKSIFIR
jgi:hypothetical protein